MNRLYTQTDNLTFIGAYFCDPFVSVTERETRGMFHQAKKIAKLFPVRKRIQETIIYRRIGKKRVFAGQILIQGLLISP
jgi:hypothetical protein